MAWDSNAVALCFGLAILAVLVTGYIVRKRMAEAEIEYLRTSGAVADGIVTQIVRDSFEGSNSQGIAYSFRTAGSPTEVERMEFLPPSSVALPKSGDHVAVRYDPRQPYRARLQAALDAIPR